MKKLLITTLLCASALIQSHAQSVQPGPTPPGPERYRTLYSPPGPEGTYNNPIRIYAKQGDTVLMGNFDVGLSSPWFKPWGWYLTPALRVMNLAYDVAPPPGGLIPHVGQFLVIQVQPTDFNENLYSVHDSITGEYTFYRICRAHNNPGIDPSN